MSTSLAGLPLVCPSCRAPIRAGPAGASCAACGASFPMRDGILDLRAGRVGAPGFDPHYFPTLAAVEREHYWFKTRREVVRDVLRDAVPDVAGRALFDIGCGSGGLLSFLGESGVPLAGACDVYAESLALVRRRVEAPLLLVDEGRFPPLGPGFTLLSLFDVLEHIDDDRGTLGHLIEILAPGGVLVLTVPAHPFLFGEMDEIAHHRRRYTRRELGDKLRGAGFRVLRLSHFMAPLVPLVGLRWLARALPRRGSSLERRKQELSVDPGPERPDERAPEAGASAGARLAAAVRLVADRRGRAAARGRCNIGPVTARRLDGTLVARQIQEELRPSLETLRARGLRPGLGVLLVGDDPASAVYVRSKTKRSEELGFFHETCRLPATASTDEVLAAVAAFNRRPEVHGILVQLPLPKQVDAQRVLDHVRPDKDVDGFHPTNVGLLVQKRPRFVACTPAGIMELLKRNQIELAGKRAVVLGRSEIVGKPMALLLLHADATVTVCPLAHARTRGGDARGGRAGGGDRPGGAGARRHVKPGAVVVDVGMNRVSDPALARELLPPERAAEFDARGYALVGDVHALEVAQVAGALTPVPGGVGPLTIAMLMANTVRAAVGAA